MKISDLLRNLADTIEADEQTPEQSISRPGALAPSVAPAVAEPILASPEAGGGLAQQPDDLFVPPLQLKMELLKKAVDVESIYDEDEEEVEQHSYPNMMTQIRRNAGLNPAVISELGDDEPLEG